MTAAPRFIAFGDTGLVVQFGETIDRDLSAAVLALDRRVDAAMRAGRAPGLVETSPSFRSLLVSFDPLVTDHAETQALLEPLLAEADAAAGAPLEPPRVWRFPVSYEPPSAPDLPEVAALTGLSEEAVVARHVAPLHHVYMVGFLPGAPYLGDLPPEIDLPRRAEPRVAVPAGSVAIAIGLTVIYPVESPGGWRLIGRTPVSLFDLARDPPGLLRPGDAVRFERVDEAALARLCAAAADGDWTPDWTPRAADRRDG